MDFIYWVIFLPLAVLGYTWAAYDIGFGNPLTKFDRIVIGAILLLQGLEIAVRILKHFF